MAFEETASADGTPSVTISPDSLELRAQLMRDLARLRSSLQRWHAISGRTPAGAAADMFRGQGRALALLEERGEMPQREMCDTLGIRPQSLGETLAKLERGGYITRKPSPRDHRALTVSITDTGRRLVHASEPTTLFSSFEDGELIQFISYIERALADIDEQVEKAAERA